MRLLGQPGPSANVLIAESPVIIKRCPDLRNQSIEDQLDQDSGSGENEGSDADVTRVMLSRACIAVMVVSG